MRAKLKPELTYEQAIESKMTLWEIYKYYFPGATIEEVDFYFWEHTPFPFDAKESLKMLYRKYLGMMKNLYPQAIE